MATASAHDGDVLHHRMRSGRGRQVQESSAPDVEDFAVTADDRLARPLVTTLFCVKPRSWLILNLNFTAPTKL